MSFELKITGGDAAELAQQAITLAFLLAPNLREKAQSAPQEAVEAEVMEEPKKPARRTRKAETIEHDEKETKADVLSDTGGAAEPDGDRAARANAVGAAEPDGDRAARANAVGAAASESNDGASEVGVGDAPDETPAEVDAVAEQPAMSVDELRKFVIGEYLNTCFESQPDRTAAFRELLKPFKLEKLGDLPANKIGEFKAAVDAKIAEKLAA